MSDTIHTPVQVQPFVDVLGVDGTIEFLLEFGGAELYFAANPTEGSRVAKSIGVEKAAALAVAAEHLPKRIPLAKPWIAAHLYQKNLPVAAIARKLHVSDVTVRSYIKQRGLAKSTRQLPLI